MTEYSTFEFMRSITNAKLVDGVSPMHYFQKPEVCQVCFRIVIKFVYLFQFAPRIRFPYEVMHVGLYNHCSGLELRHPFTVILAIQSFVI